MGIKSKRDKFQIGALLLPGVMVFALFTIYPITKLFYMSFFEWDFGTMLEHPFCGIKNYIDVLSDETFATVYKGNIIKNLIMDCQSYTKYRPNETTGGIFVSWRRKEELPTGA